MKNRKLIFEDHFDGEALDRSVWTVETGFLRNGEPQCFTDRPENLFVQDGCLYIRTLREQYRGAEYTSASITTGRTLGFTYGRLEMRAKLPRSRALWPAFWTLGSCYYREGINWPLCGEIDIMEMTGGAGLRDYQAIPAVHWLSKESGKPAIAGGRDHLHTHDRPLCEDFHVYAVEWDKQSMTFYFDDLVIFRCDITPDMQGAFDHPHSIILNTSLEHWDENTYPNEDTDLPQDYIIDYVRVYEEETP